MSPRMLLCARVLTGLMVIHVMVLMTFGTVMVFTSDLTALSTPAASAYSALVGIPGAGLYGLYKWARSDRNREARERDQ